MTTATTSEVGKLWGISSAGVLAFWTTHKLSMPGPIGRKGRSMLWDLHEVTDWRRQHFDNKPTAYQRFLDKAVIVDRWFGDSPCVEWAGTPNSKSLYRTWCPNGVKSQVGVHRWAYEHWVG